MKIKAHDIKTYAFSQADQLLLDVNIWLAVYGPVSNPDDWRVKVYSAALKKIAQRHCSVFLDVLILSEFINRYARLEYSFFKDKYGEFKEFRQSEDFKPVAEEIAANVTKIARRCHLIETGISSVNLPGLMYEFQKGQVDFNDQVLLTICQNRDLKLVTNDIDFVDMDVTIITADRRFLSR